MLSLIHHPNPFVRHAAMVHCLNQRTEIVLPLLEAEAKRDIREERVMYAKWAVEDWHAGRWKLD